jgi:hypothetical protein
MSEGLVHLPSVGMFLNKETMEMYPEFSSGNPDFSSPTEPIMLNIEKGEIKSLKNDKRDIDSSFLLDMDSNELDEIIMAWYSYEQRMNELTHVRDSYEINSVEKNTIEQ